MKIKLFAFAFFICIFNLAHAFIDEAKLEQALKSKTLLRIQAFEEDCDNPLVNDLKFFTLTGEKPLFGELILFFEKRNFNENPLEYKEYHNNLVNLPINLSPKDIVFADFFMKAIAGKVKEYSFEEILTLSLDQEFKVRNTLRSIGRWAYLPYTHRIQKLFTSDTLSSEITPHFEKCFNSILVGSYKVWQKDDENLHVSIMEALTSGKNKDENAQIYIQRVINTTGAPPEIIQIDTYLKGKPITYIGKRNVQDREPYTLNDLKDTVEKQNEQGNVYFSKYIGYASLDSRKTLIFEKAEGLSLDTFFNDCVKAQNIAFFTKHLSQIVSQLGQMHSSSFKPTQKGFCCFTHGDLNFSNLFYSLSQKKLTAIDYASIEVQGNVENDFFFFYSLTNFLLNHAEETKWTQEENFQIVETLKKAYFKASPDSDWGKGISNTPFNSYFDYYLSNFE